MATIEYRNGGMTGPIVRTAELRRWYDYVIRHAGELSDLRIVRKSDGGAHLVVTFMDDGNEKRGPLIDRILYVDFADFTVLVDLLSRSRVLAYENVVVRHVGGGTAQMQARKLKETYR